MLHLVRVVAVLGIVTLPAAAQAQVGVRVGANMASLSSDPAPVEPLEEGRLTGLVAGAFVTLPVNDIFGFQPEALYSRQGSILTYPSIPSISPLRTKLDYLQAPLLARVRTGARSPLAVLFGPSLGFKIRERPLIRDVAIDPAANDSAEQFKTFDFGLAAGAAFDAGNIVVDGRYTWGVTNISDIGAKTKNRVLSVSAGLKFGR